MRTVQLSMCNADSAAALRPALASTVAAACGNGGPAWIRLYHPWFWASTVKI